MKKYGWQVTVIYFMIVAIGLSISNKALQPLMILIPFLGLLWTAKQWLNFLLGLLVLGWSGMIFLAYLFEAFKMDTYDSDNLYVLIGG